MSGCMHPLVIRDNKPVHSEQVPRFNRGMNEHLKNPILSIAIR